MTTKETIQKYFAALNEKKDWELYIADSIVFTSPGGKTESKEAYVKATNGFLRFVKLVKISKLIVEGYNASVIAHYRLQGPNGITSESKIAEIFEVKNNKIKSSAVFFDTAAFREFVAKGNA